MTPLLVPGHSAPEPPFPPPIMAEILPQDVTPAHQPANVVEMKPRATRAKTSVETNSDRQDSNVVFRCTNIGKTFVSTASRLALSDISIELRTNQIVGLVGVNGVGKTTLLRIIAGEIAPSRGDLSYPLLHTGPHNWKQIRQQIAYVPQLPKPWYGPLLAPSRNRSEPQFRS